MLGSASMGNTNVSFCQQGWAPADPRALGAQFYGTPANEEILGSLLADIYPKRRFPGGEPPRRRFPMRAYYVTAPQLGPYLCKWGIPGRCSGASRARSCVSRNGISRAHRIGPLTPLMDLEKSRIMVQYFITYSTNHIFLQVKTD